MRDQDEIYEIFPIQFTNTEDGQMASFWINGRHFTLDLDNNERYDGGHDCAAISRDNGKVVVTIEMKRGKAISCRVAYCAYKKYVRNLGGRDRVTFDRVEKRPAKEGGAK